MKKIEKGKRQQESVQASSSVPQKQPASSTTKRGGGGRKGKGRGKGIQETSAIHHPHMPSQEHGEAVQEPPPTKRRRSAIKCETSNPEDIMEEAARLEARSEEMRRKAASLRSKANSQQETEMLQSKRRLVIQGCADSASS